MAHQIGSGGTGAGCVVRVEYLRSGGRVDCVMYYRCDSRTAAQLLVNVIDKHRARAEIL